MEVLKSSQSCLVALLQTEGAALLDSGMLPPLIQGADIYQALP